MVILVSPKMKKKYFYFLTFFCAVFLCLINYPVLAASGLGIGVSPVKIEDVVDPGQVLQKEIRVTNNSSSAITFYAYLKDFKASEDENGAPKVIAPGSEEGYFLASWIDITAEGIEFGPNEEKTISFTINVPPETGPGGYYGGVYFGTEPPQIHLDEEEKGAGMAIGQQTGCLVLLQVKGAVYEEARIREFNTDKELYNTPFEVKFITRIENLGNVHVKPYGAITIENMFGKEIAVVRVNEKGGNILPKSIRKFEDEFWKDTMGFGRYKAKLGLVYGTSPDMGGQGKQSIFSEKYFWIFPWKIIMPIILGLVFFTGLMFLLLKLYKNKAVRKAMEQAGLGQVRYVQQYQGPSPALHLTMILLIVFIVLFLIVASLYFFFFA